MCKITNIEVADQCLNRTALIHQWRVVYGRSPPKHLSLRLIQSALVWEEQAKASGGIPAKVLCSLRNAGGLQTTAVTITTLNAGAVLVREWNGCSYQVSVLEHGFRMDGKEFASLTAIAKKITGAKWSGPRFFGLNGKRGAKHA
ncbi:MAG: DUF2924 domain-containing protein [Amylibacter sp.]